MKPAAVLRQAKAAEQQIADFKAGKAPPPQAAPVGEVPPNLPNVGDVPPPGAQPVAAAPQPEAAPPAPAAQPEDWEQKYKVLEGKYRAEVPRLNDVVRETQTIADQALRQNQQLLTQLSQAQQQQAQPAQPARREDTLQSLVTDKEREAFGEDLVDMIGRRAQEAVLPAVQQILSKELQPLKAQMGQAQASAAQMAQDRVYRALNEHVPNWQAINNDVEFLAWLESIDVFSGSSRRQALTNAFNSNDASRVVGIFKAYVQEDASRSTSQRQPQVAAETLIAPGAPRGGTVQEVAPGSRGKIWSESEIKSFYDRVRRKQVKPEEYASMAAELAAAARDGRIRPDRPDIHMNQR